MGVDLNGSSQWMQAPWAPGAIKPMAFMGWVRRDANTTASIFSAGDIDDALAFHALQCRDDLTRAITFLPSALSANGAIVPTGTVQFVMAVFVDQYLYIYVDDDAPVVTSGWPSGSSPIDQVRIGNTVSNTYNAERLNGVIEHAAAWFGAVPTTEEIAALRARTVNPATVQTSALVFYKPLKTDLADAAGAGLSWTNVDLAAPSYVDLGIEYPGSGPDEVTASAALVQASHSLSAAATVGSDVSASAALSQAPHALAASATVELVPVSASVALSQAPHTLSAAAYVPGRTIDHTNFDPSGLSDAQISAAAVLKVYIEHASTGQDIVGDSDTDSSEGLNYDLSGDCGLKLLHALNNRYLCNRESFTTANDPEWFLTNNGLQDNNRGNPTPALKLSGFLGMSASMRTAVDVATFKFCWIDVWPSIEGYVSDGAAFAASLISDIEAFESANPSIVVPYWTMPLQSNESYAAREAFNAAIRTYCSANGRWLIDIADIECHDDAGVKQIDGSGREVMAAAYAAADGGHLSEAGRIKLARAWWSLLAAVAADAEVTDDVDASVALGQAPHSLAASAPVGASAAAALSQAPHVLAASATVIRPVSGVADLIQAPHAFAAIASTSSGASATLVQAPHALTAIADVDASVDIIAALDQAPHALAAVATVIQPVIGSVALSQTTHAMAAIAEVEAPPVSATVNLVQAAHAMVVPEGESAIEFTIPPCVLEFVIPRR